MKQSNNEPNDVLANYVKMLDLAYLMIPSVASKHKRLEVPKPQSRIMGRRGPTVMFNFKEVCETLNRDPHDVLRFLSKEMATAGTMAGSRVTFKGMFESEALKRLIDHYVRDFVICPVCRSLDTRIAKEKRLKFRICDACGAKSSVKAI
jgi:translation initiation factor 2 subunit 2